MVTEYSTISEIAGPLILLDDVDHATYEELVEVELPDGELRRGKVLEVDRRKVLIQIFEGTRGVDIPKTKVRFQLTPKRSGWEGLPGMKRLSSAEVMNSAWM